MRTPVDRHSIVVGIDGSPAAVGAARWAGAIANRQHAPLVLLGVVPALDFPLTTSVLAEVDLLPELRAAAKNKVREAFEAVRAEQPELEIRQIVEEGTPARELIEHSAGARMVVVAAKAQDRLSTLLLGSTALTVANKANCPVTVWRGRLDQPLPDERPVLVGVDGSPGGAAAIGEAYELASALGVEVVALHAWNDPDLLQWTPVPDTWIALAQQEKELLSERLAGWSDKFPDVAITQVVEKATPAQALLEHAEKAQLVLTGSRGHNRLTGLLLGSTSQNLLHNAASPVVICRER
ncbi:universal stress protein [Nocardia gamkensis]|uniref:Universal stress protein n=1 Tax=Nocardia gamkensis TaxID=352869 RepID=A0A7X6L8T3_9NOCA|nr:universal stress protein [Nocardia gamkensis]NKY29863.1 universal stress protein [Nocardia gamkensis]NQE69943.1 Universal stress protein [Nocardia gamkensis]